MRFKRCAASLLDSPDWQSWSLSGIESPYANPTLTSCGARQRLSAAPTDIVITTRDGVEEIADQAAFFASRPTMGEHLAKLVAPTLPMDRCILVSHAPPIGVGLGVLHSGGDVGSRAVPHRPLRTHRLSSTRTDAPTRAYDERH